MKKKSMLFLTLVLVCSNHVKSQFIMPDKKEAADFKNRSLIVQLRTPDKDILEKYKKEPENAEAYKNHIEAANELIKQALEKHWKMHDKISFLNALEIEEFLSNKDEKQYALVKMEEGTEIRNEPNSTKVVIHGYQFSALLAGKKKPLFSCMIPNDRISLFEYEFLLSNMQKYLNASSVGKNRNDTSLWDYERNKAKLEKNTLVLPKSVLGIEEEEAKKNYGYPLSIVPDKEIADYYSIKKEGILLASVLFHSKKNIWMYVIIDPATMDIVSLVPSNAGVNFSLRVAKFGYSKTYGYVELIDLLTFRSSSGFEKSHFKAIPLKLAFKFNY